jgi:signal transduction protein with GAF and PtsI domain
MESFEPISVEERVRILESRYGLMRDRIFLINQNMIQEYRKLNKDMKLINDEVKSVKQDLNEIKNVLRNMVNEMQTFARKENVKVIEKYINFWNPLNFMTEKDVIQIIKRGEKDSIEETASR